MRSSSFYVVPSNRTKKGLNAPRFAKSKRSSSVIKPGEPVGLASEKKRKKLVDEKKRKMEIGTNKIYRACLNYARSDYRSKVGTRELSQEYGIPMNNIKRNIEMFSKLIHGEELRYGPPKKQITKVLNHIIKMGTEEEIKNTLDSLSGHLIKRNVIEEYQPKLNEIAKKYNIEIEPIIPQKRAHFIKPLFT